MKRGRNDDHELQIQDLDEELLTFLAESAVPLDVDQLTVNETDRPLVEKWLADAEQRGLVSPEPGATWTLTPAGLRARVQLRHTHRYLTVAIRVPARSASMPVVWFESIRAQMRKLR